MDKDPKLEQQKVDVQKDFKGFFLSLKEFLSDLLDIKNDTDIKATSESIKASIPVKGHTAWILVYSIVIASIGLNVSSAPVVIGAMLISPLMGPILGIGYSIGINDIDTLRSSLMNFGVMVILSVITSFAIFSIPIFQEATPEIIARTKPDVRDVLIGISGGLALIVAISRPKPLFNTVAGVAIATALMPPLCTAGYGLATMNLSYFSGALFLFAINSIFIALAAFAIIRYLQFPMVKYINEANRKRISQMASLIAVIIFSASIYTFYQLYLEQKYFSQANKFITALKEEGINIIGDDQESIDYQNREIKLYVFGSNFEQNDKERWGAEMEKYGLTDTELKILQSQDDSKIRNDIDELKELYVHSNKIISSRDETILEKDRRIAELEKDLRSYYKNELVLEGIGREIKINYNGIERISFAKEFSTNFEKVDTIPVVSVKWKNSIRKKTRKDEEEKLKLWLQERFDLNNIEMREIQ